MPQPRPKRTLEELHGVWGHLAYEIQMLNETGRVLSTFKADETNDRERVIQNALIESFALHARSVLAFLYPENPRSDDVVADDFFGDPSEWRKKRPPMTDLLKTVHRRVGQEVAHLTYARAAITDEQRRWPFVKIAVDIDSALREFANLLPADLIKPPAPGFPAMTQAPQGVVTEVGSKRAG